MKLGKWLLRLLRQPDSSETTKELRQENILHDRQRREIARRLAAVEVTMPVRPERGKRGDAKRD